MAKKYSSIILSFLGVLTMVFILAACGQSNTSNPPPADAISVVRGYYDAFNKKEIDTAVSYIADDALFINPTGTYTGRAEIQPHLQALADQGFFFDLSQFKDEAGRVTYAYKVLQNGQTLDSGTGGLTIVENGKIVFDGTETSEPERSE
jgi:ketosteroid isomerase-like protein